MKRLIVFLAIILLAGTTWSGQTASKVLSLNVDSDVHAALSLTVTEYSVHTVGLSWTASAPNGDLLNYEVYRGTISGGPYTLLATINSTSYEDLTIMSGTTYYYVVTALDTVTGLQSMNSNQATAAVPSP